MSVEVTGSVVERGSGAGLPGLRVQAWRDAHEAVSGEGRTGDDGVFTLSADTGDDTGLEPGVAFSFRVLRGEELVLDTAGRIVWTSERPDLEVLIEVDAPPTPITEVRGRLLGRDRAAPLAGLVVVLNESRADGESTPIGAFRTDAEGAFTATLREGQTQLSAVVHDANGAFLAEASTVLRRGQLQVRCDLSPHTRPDPSLIQAAEELGVGLPQDYLAKLTDAGVNTFAEFGRAPDELVQPDGAPDGVTLLRAAAGFRTLTPDLELIGRLVKADYRTLGAVAHAPAEPFADRLELEPGAAAVLQHQARAQEAYLRTLIAGERTALTRTHPNGQMATTALASVSSAATASCACCDCRSAVSPAAYLADLLAYTVDHVTRDGQRLTLDDVIALTLQPLRDLPLDCDSIDTDVPRLRIIVEVLRAHLTAEWANVPQDRRDALEAAERVYLSVAYERLLVEHGTSFAELRDAKVATAEERSALAARLGVDLTPPPDPLVDLLLDPNAAPPELTEAALQRLFGYQDTTADPLADIAPGLLADRRRDHQRQSWLAADHAQDAYSFELEPPSLPTIDPDIVDTVDFRNQNPGGNPCFSLHAARRIWVDDRVTALGQDLAADGVATVLGTALGTPGPDLDALATDLEGSAADAQAARDELETLGLTLAAFARLMEIRDAAAAPPPASPPTAADLQELAEILTQSQKVRVYPTWVQQEAAADVRLDLRRFRLVDVAKVPERAWLGPRTGRVEWQAALRRRMTAPVVDPLLLGPVDFRDPSPSQLGYQLWEDRRQFIATRLATYGGGAPNLTVFDNRVRTVLDDLSAARWVRLAAEYAAGDPLTEQLETYTLTRPELGRLVRLRAALADGLPVSDAEWQEAAQVLVRILVRRQSPQWHSEERAGGLVLGPDDFVLAGLSDVTPVPPLGTAAERGAWQDVLRARIDQDAAARTAALTAVRVAEEQALPLLRNALVAACEVPFTDPAARGDWLGDRLLIDVLTGPTDRTTRVAQAIESLQLLLFSLRTAQLSDTHPDLDLVAEHFDEEWEWVGGYATWRAAMFVFLYPENLLLPSLRRHQTYGMRQLVSVLRSARRATPSGVLREVRSYLDYFDDVASLEVAAVAVAGSGQGDAAREYTYLFGQAPFSGTVYWSRNDATGVPGRTQSSWAPVTSLSNVDVVRVVGACPSRSFGRDWLYLIVQVFDDSGETKLAFTRLDLERAGSLVDTQDNGWTEYQEPDLPDGAGTFTAVLVQDRYATWPRIALHAQDSRFYLRRIVDTDWEDGDWSPINLTWSNLPQTGLESLLSVVHVNFWGELVFARYSSGVTYALFVATYQGLRSVRALTTSARIWQGALLIDDTSQATNPAYPRAGTTRVYAFWSDGGISWYQSFGVATTGIFTTVTSSNSWLDVEGRLAVSGGDTSPELADGSRVQVAFRRGGPFQGTGWAEPGQYLTSVRRLAVDSVLVEGPRQHIAPRFKAASIIQIQQAQRDPQRRYLLDGFLLNRRYWWDRGANTPASNRDYLWEACGLVPLHAAQALQQRREFVAALDWYRVVYDYAAPPGSRDIFPALVDELTLSADFDRAADWLLDTMNPWAVAETRRGSSTRAVIISIVRCLLEHADDFYGTDLAEGIAQARSLYGTALDLLDTDELRQDDGACEEVIGELDVTVGGPEWVTILEAWGRELLALQRPQTILDVIEMVNNRLRADRPWADRVDAARTVIDDALASVSTPTPPEAVEQQLEQTEVAHRALMRSTAVEDVLVSVGDASRVHGRARAETTDDFEADGVGHLPTGIARWAMTAGEELETFTLGFWAPAPHFGFCVVPNPIPRTLRLWAELNLFKIRTGRNISGLERAVDAYSAPTDATSGLPSIGAGGQLSVPGARSYRPTPYRYPQLIARARDLAQLAQQVESSMLAAIQAGDQERYTRLKAVHDLAIGRAGVRLQTLRATEATGGVKLAELSKQRAALSLTHYTDLIDEGWTAAETAALVTLGFSASFHQAAAISAGVAASISGSYAAGLTAGFYTAALAPPHWAAMASSLASASSSQAAALQTVSSMLSMQAGFDRRLEEWELQRSLAAQDVTIADQQIQLAEDHVRVVAQEREIAQLTTDQAEEIIEFLDNKFTNVELYDFMAGELERVYGTVLEQATATARLAADQLAFERQEDPPTFIRADYWQTSDEGLGTADQGAAADRRGLTGSAQLLGDLVQLDGYAFDTDRRKQHLTVTLSVAQLAPVEFARFRQTGELTFDTPGGWFDRQFPGHYLRLIRRVRLSVVALIPPNTGIRATLAQSGPSWVTIGGPTFSRVRVRGGGFDEVALSSPYSDSGVFELDPQPTLRFPFEGGGLDTRWTLRLPRAANPFDLGTVADVLMTVEYTALSDANLRLQTIAALSPTTEVTIPLSIRTRYPDQWYQLHNRRDATPPFRITLNVPKAFLPAHLTGVQLSQVALLLAHEAGALPAPVTVDLLGRPTGSGVVGTGAVVAVNGLASSRGNAQGWNSLPRDPVGSWVLQFKDDQATRDLFDSGDLEDVLLALTVSGRSHPWI